MRDNLLTKEEIFNLSTTKKKQSWFDKIHVALILMSLPTIIYIFMFHYLPIGGLVIAFEDYNVFEGFSSPIHPEGIFYWFKVFLKSPDFWVLIKNTLVLSGLSILFNTICPIFFALLINEVCLPGFKKLSQTIMYAPYFISTMVVVGMLFTFFNTDYGVLYKFFCLFGVDTNMMEDPKAFAMIYVISGLWQGLGWWSITYMGTLSNIDPALHDAAKIDGAGRLRRIHHINLPSIIPLATIMLIMSIGNILTVGFEKVFLMQTQANLSTSNIISTYVYRVSFPKGSIGIGQYSLATAIGLFNSIVNIIILVIANTVSKKVSENSLW